MSTEAVKLEARCAFFHSISFGSKTIVEKGIDMLDGASKVTHYVELGFNWIAYLNAPFRDRSE